MISKRFSWIRFNSLGQRMEKQWLRNSWRESKRQRYMMTVMETTLILHMTANGSQDGAAKWEMEREFKPGTMGRNMKEYGAKVNSLRVRFIHQKDRIIHLITKESSWRHSILENLSNLIIMVSVKFHTETSKNTMHFIRIRQVETCKV